MPVGTLSEPAPVRPGVLVRTLGTVLPGVRRTGEQIESFAATWHRRNLEALESGLPLLVALGDSLAQGIGATSVDHGYVGRLAERFHGELAVINLSRSGARLADVLDRQLAELARVGIEPAVVTCTVGSNDLLRGANPLGAAAAMRRLVSVLPRTAVMGTLPDQGSLMARSLNRVVRTEVAARGLVLADVSAEMSGWRGKTASDGFHPNDLGYGTWVAAFVPAVERVIARSGGVRQTGEGHEPE